MKQFTRIGFAVLFLGVTALVATAQNVHPVTGEALAQDQTFVYRNEHEAHSIDPGLADDVAGADIIRDLFEGLYSQKADGTLRPGVALSHSVSNDGLTYTFNLRDNAIWSNGDPVTAGDFEYAWKRFADPAVASPYSSFAALMALENARDVLDGSRPTDALGVSALDDRTLEVRLTRPLPHFTQMTTHVTTFPVHHPTVETFGEDWTRPENIVSNGPFILSKHAPDDRLERVRNTSYWNNAETILDTITTVIIPDTSEAFDRYLDGELDLTNIPDGQFQVISKAHPDHAVSVPRACSQFFTINLTNSGNPALADPNVRKALSYAIDRTYISDTVLGGGQRPSHTLTHWATPYWNAPELEIAIMAQDARNARAKDLLTSAGFSPEGKVLEIELFFNTSDTQNAIAEAISAMWQEVLGVNTTLSHANWDAYVDRMIRKDYQVARSVWCSDYNDPSSYLDLFHSGSNYNDAGYVNADIDRLLEQSATADDRALLYQQIERLASEDVPIIPVFHYSLSKMMSPQLKGWPLENVQQQWYGRDLYKVADDK